MKSIQRLIGTPSQLTGARHRELTPAESAPLLPCRFQFFHTAPDPLETAQQYCSLQLYADALRFVQLCLLTESEHPDRQWKLRLATAVIHLHADQKDAAWHELQKALAWRNRHEGSVNSSLNTPPIHPVEWLAMASIALANHDPESAEVYAAECVHRLNNDAAFRIVHVLRDFRADAMTVFASIRIAQTRLQEAEMLLQLASDGHRLAGDIEQMVVDCVLLADVELLSGSVPTARQLLGQALQLLTENTDLQRHSRFHQLFAAITGRQRTVTIRECDTGRWN